MQTLTLTTGTASDAALGFSFLGGVAGAALIIFITTSIILYALLVLAEWKIFKKAGEKGWKSLIPIYNLYIVFKIFWDKKWFWFYIGGVFVLSLIQNILAELLGSSNFFTCFFGFASTVYVVGIAVTLYYREARSFGHGTAFTIGLLLLPNIFTLILGFNKDKYKKLAK